MERNVALGMFLAMGQVLYNAVLDDYHSDSEDEDDLGAGDRNDVVRIEGYVENVIPNLEGHQFQEHFRVTREAFINLMTIVGPMLRREDALGRPTIDPQCQLLAVLWLLATPDSYRSVGECFDMGKSSLFACFERVVSALTEIASRIISWPRGDRLPAIKADFERMGGIPNVIGAVDGTFIPIKAPKDDPEVWITRKCNFAMTLQAICDSWLRFIDAFVGYPGSVSDTRIFRNSDIYNDIRRNRANYIDPGDVIIGDCAYPVLDWCIPPYVNRGNLTAEQRHFNHRLSQTRQTIERSFGLLFGRFRRLKYLDMNRMDLVPATVLAACVLHNICLSFDDRLLQIYEEEGQEFLRREDRVELGNDRDVFDRDVRGEQRRNEMCRVVNQIVNDP